MAHEDGSVVINTKMNTSGIRDGVNQALTSMKGLASSATSMGGKLFSIGKTMATSLFPTNLMKEAGGRVVSLFSGIIKKILTPITAVGKAVGKTFKGIGTKIAGLAKKIAVPVLAAAGALTTLAIKATELGSDLDEVQNVVDVTFTAMSEKVNEFAKTAMEAYGLSETVAKQFVGTYGSMAKSLGFTEEAAYNMSTQMTALVGDVASFYNLDQEEAFNKLKGILTGETEGLKTLGVVMNESALEAFAASQGIDKELSKMTEREKAALRYKFVLEKLSGAQGDFNRTSDGWANQTRVLKLKLDSILATLGKALINIFTPLLRVINKILDRIKKLSEALYEFSKKLMGIQDDDTAGKGAVLEDAAALTDELADSEEEEAEAKKKQAKAQQKYLSGLDEARTYQDKSKDDDEEENEDLINIPEYEGLEDTKEDVEEVNDKLQALKDTVRDLKEAFAQGFADNMEDMIPHLINVKNNVDRIGTAAKEIFTDPQVVNAAKNFADKAAYDLGSITASCARIGAGAAELFTGGIASYLEQKKEDIKNQITEMFNVSGEIMDLIAELFHAIADAFEPLWSAQAQQILADILATISDIFFTITNTVLKLVRDMLNIIIQPILDNKEKIKTYFEGILAFLEPVFSGIRTGVERIVQAWNTLYDEHIKPFFDAIADGFSTILGAILDGWNTYISPVLEQLGKRFQEIMEGPFGETVDAVGEAIGAVIDVLTELWKEVIVPLAKWFIDNIYPILARIVSWVGNKILDAFELVLGVIKDLATKLKEFADDLKGKIKPAVEEAKKKFDEFYQTTLKPILDFLKEKFLKAWQDVKTWLATNIPAAIATLKGKWDDFKRLWLIPFAEWLGETFIAKWKDLKAWLDEKVPKALEVASGAFTRIKEEVIDPINKFLQEKVFSTLSDLGEWLSSKLPGSFDELRQGVSDVYDNTIKPLAEYLGDKFVKAFDGVTTALQGVNDFIYNIFIGDWQSVWNTISETVPGVFNGLGEKVTTIFNGLVGIIANPINSIIDMINNMIGSLESGLNSIVSAINNTVHIHFDPIPSPFGGNLWDGIDWGPSLGSVVLPRVPKIPTPALAKGAVIPPNAPFMALLGDQRRGLNIEAPADEIYQQALKAVREEMAQQDKVQEARNRQIMDRLRKDLEARKSSLTPGQFEQALKDIEKQWEQMELDRAIRMEKQEREAKERAAETAAQELKKREDERRIREERETAVINNLNAAADNVRRVAQTTASATSSAPKTSKEVLNVNVGGRKILEVILDEAKKTRYRTGKNVFELS